MSSVGMQMSPPGSFFSAGKEPAHLAGSAGYAKPDMEWALRGAASSIHLEVVPTLRVLAFSCATTLSMTSLASTTNEQHHEHKFVV
jgi:hypothetical protein